MDRLTGKYDVVANLKIPVVRLLQLRRGDVNDAVIIRVARATSLKYLEWVINCELLAACRFPAIVDEKHIGVQHLAVLYKALISSHDDDPVGAMSTVLFPGVRIYDFLVKRHGIQQAVLVCKDNSSFTLVRHFDGLATTNRFFLRGMTFLALKSFDIIVQNEPEIGMVTHETIHPVSTFLAEFYATYGLPNDRFDRCVSGKKIDVEPQTMRGDPLRIKAQQLKLAPTFSFQTSLS